ncbi:MAG: hypothetical protein ABL903_18475 [Methylococcales bacterium]
MSGVLVDPDYGIFHIHDLSKSQATDYFKSLVEQWKEPPKPVLSLLKTLKELSERLTDPIESLDLCDKSSLSIRNLVVVSGWKREFLEDLLEYLANAQNAELTELMDWLTRLHSNYALGASNYGVSEVARYIQKLESLISELVESRSQVFSEDRA